MKLDASRDAYLKDIKYIEKNLPEGKRFRDAIERGTLETFPQFLILIILKQKIFYTVYLNEVKQSLHIPMQHTYFPINQVEEMNT